MYYLCYTIMNNITREQQNLVNEIKSMGLDVSVSQKEWGTSIYCTINGIRVRFSDHETSGFSGRHETELHVFGFAANWGFILDGVAHKITAHYSYTYEVVTKESHHVEYVHTDRNSKAFKVSDVKFVANGSRDKKGRTLGTLTFKKYDVRFVGA